MQQIASEFRCPVCGAKQALQNTCRRCSADLELLVALRRRLDYLLARCARLDSNDVVAADACKLELEKEIQMLSPRLLKN